MFNRASSEANKQLFLFLYEFLRFTRHRHKYVIIIYLLSKPRVCMFQTKNRGKNASTLSHLRIPCVRQRDRRPKRKRKKLVSWRIFRARMFTRHRGKHAFHLRISYVCMSTRYRDEHTNTPTPLRVPAYADLADSTTNTQIFLPLCEFPRTQNWQTQERGTQIFVTPLRIPVYACITGSSKKIRKSFCSFTNLTRTHHHQT